MDTARHVIKPVLNTRSLFETAACDAASTIHQSLAAGTYAASAAAAAAAGTEAETSEAKRTYSKREVADAVRVLRVVGPGSCCLLHHSPHHRGQGGSVSLSWDPGRKPGASVHAEAPPSLILHTPNSRLLR